MSIITLTEPDTPLNDADHVGSFKLYGREKMELKKHQVPMTIPVSGGSYRFCNAYC